ncbi:MAG: hypothetical protein QM728_14740 [Gordonia sp. (in: high G+C Gram-positive bacteria)]
MFTNPARRGRRNASCVWGPLVPGRKPKSKSRFYNAQTKRWEWRYCY